MDWLLLVAVLLVLLALFVRERFTDTEFRVTRPGPTPDWKSKIDAQSPIGADDDAYIAVLQRFYDTVYVPSPTKPTDKDIEVFVNSQGNQPGVDIAALRKILVSAFHADITTPAAAREEAEVKFQPDSAILQPKEGRDEVFVRTEDLYVPADSRLGELPEGIYAPVKQQPNPRRPGEYDDKSTSWTQDSFYNVCTSGPCTKNVL